MCNSLLIEVVHTLLNYSPFLLGIAIAVSLGLLLCCDPTNFPYEAVATKTGQQAPLTITSALVSAVLEWILIFMLLIVGSFSYLVTVFARCCQLQLPCLFCSRLDHVLGNERPGFYWDLVCCKHKSKISSLVFCRLHNELVDVRGICKTCFSSFSTINKSDAEIYGLIAGKLDNEPHHDPSQLVSLSQCDVFSPGLRKCTCCNGQWILETCVQKLYHGQSINCESPEINAASSLTPVLQVDQMQETVEGDSQRDQVWNRDAHPLADSEYKKVTVTSCIEPEGPSTDNGCADAYFHQMETSSLASMAKHVPPEVIPLSGFSAEEKLIHPDSLRKLSPSVSEDESKLACDVRYGSYEEPLGNGPEKLNWQPAVCKNNVFVASKLISSPEALSSPTQMNTLCYNESKGMDVSNITEWEKEVHVACVENPNMGSYLSGNAESWKEVDTKHQEISGCGNDSIQDFFVKPNNTDTSMQESLDLRDAYKLAVGTRGRQLSGRLLEKQKSMTDSTRASEDLLLLLSQISVARAIDSPLNGMSPRISANSEDFKSVDASGVIGMQKIHRRPSLERNESGLSFDASMVSEIDGETVADHLERQVEHDKKIMNALYKELVEERNASAIAATQAMAMITRLQEEKAALNMEALQCLRMMEEQAEYDDEALQKANYLLAEKEKQIQDFEHELKFYKSRFGDRSLSYAFVMPSSESDANQSEAYKVGATCEKGDTTTIEAIDNDSHGNTTNKIDGLDNLSDREISSGMISLRRFEDEKQFILQYLRKLKEKLALLSRCEAHPHMRDGSGSRAALLETPSNQSSCVGDSQEKGETENSNLIRDVVMHGGVDNAQHEGGEFDKFMSRMHVSRDAELDAFRHELSGIHDRLEVIEAEQNVIECSINSLKKGSEGFEFLRQIAVQIQDLHSYHTRRNEDLR